MRKQCIVSNKDNKMNIQTVIKNKVNTTSKIELVKQLEYSSLEKGLETLEIFLNHNNINDWLQSGHYDFKYNTEQFFIKLCEVLNISKQDVELVLNKKQVLLDEIASIKSTYIFINTNFKRTTQPIFALAFCESQRRIKLNLNELIFKSDIEVKEYISEIVKNHYKETSGSIGIWGNIVSYLYHYKDNTRYIFNTDGILMENEDVFESKAILTI